MKTFLLPIPTKKSDEVNWQSPLNRYLTSIYGESHEYQQDINLFDKLRKDLKGVNADKTGIKLYFKYYSQLELLDLRIPFTNLNSKKISFVWYDAFEKSVSHKQHALPFEKANVLFNIASILTRVGCVKYDEAQRSKEESDEATKEALQLLQQAAGVLEFIGENFLHAPSEDLSQGTLRFLKKFMVAQSQEVFVLKVITGDLDQTKNSLIAKLCTSTTNHFNECEKMIDNHRKFGESVSTADFEITGDDYEEDEELEAIVESEEDGDKSGNMISIQLDSLWVAVIHFKVLYYKSLAYYFNGLHLESSRKYGDAIAYLSKSQDVLNEISALTLRNISKSGVNDAYEILDNYKYQKDALAIKLADLTKDNDLVYHEIIPSLITLPEIKPLDSAKVIPMSKIALFEEITDQTYNSFLKNVVPIDTHELLSYYSEEKSQFLRNELDSVDVSNEELSSVLEYLKMPKAIVSLKEIVNTNVSLGSSSDSTNEIDPVTLGKVSEIHQNYSSDVANKSKVIELREQIYSVISEIDSKRTFANDSRYQDDTLKLKKSLYDATTSDDKLFSLINIENSELYNIIGRGPNSKEFKSLFEPHQTKNPEEEISLIDIIDKPQTSSGSIDAQIKKIEDILYDLNVIKANKQKLVDNLKKEIHNDDISDIIVLNSKVKTTSEIKSVIFPEELKKFDPFSKELDKLNESQKRIIQNLKDEWDSLNANPKVKDIQSSKTFKDTIMKDQVSRINSFYDNEWKKYHTGLKKGVEFYNQILNFAKSMKQSMEREENESMAGRFSNMNLSANSTGNSFNQSAYNQPQAHSQPSYNQSQGYGQPGYNQAHSNIQYGQPQGSASQQYGQQYNSYHQPTLSRSLTSSSQQFGTYDRPAPSLPPKQPYQQAQAPQSYHQSQAPQSYQQPQAYPQPQQHQAPAQRFTNPQNASQSSLIYDQPSTYNPDMYNYFSKQ